ncbi:hypothetical protein BpHYR1_045730 [Brachionus plicatilis]|uniref:Uncharacterized protein n=1 Tax=Brachionus plicatilis TaxID=10195 RepID=A0A3M7PXB1_BRAPC|nr:hypothetical protein BpHYR1_045730 [Brachionus plicatilis]
MVLSKRNCLTSSASLDLPDLLKFSNYLDSSSKSIDELNENIAPSKENKKTFQKSRFLSLKVALISLDLFLMMEENIIQTLIKEKSLAIFSHSL